MYVQQEETSLRYATYLQTIGPQLTLASIRWASAVCFTGKPLASMQNKSGLTKWVICPFECRHGSAYDPRYPSEETNQHSVQGLFFHHRCWELNTSEPTAFSCFSVVKCLESKAQNRTKAEYSRCGDVKRPLNKTPPLWAHPNLTRQLKEIPG